MILDTISVSGTLSVVLWRRARLRCCSSSVHSSDVRVWESQRIRLVAPLTYYNWENESALKWLSNDVISPSLSLSLIM